MKILKCSTFRVMFIVFLLMPSTTTFAAVQNTEIIISLDGPVGQVTGGGTVVGWAIAPTGIAEMLLYIDGEEYSTIPMGSLRKDVGAKFPTYPNSDLSGFSLYIPFFILDKGSHVLSIFAIDGAGKYNVLTTTIDTTVFEGIWSPASEVDLSNITETRTKETLVLRNFKVQGVNHKVTLNWDYVLQGLAIKQIQRQ
ncbi:MAG: hypothetical protein DRR42_24640 [Gammaproteobacteria bacterium]|nr:MAG: hypothetical protein DRR42_24640 [Gammaproteobacteria bacterium]